MLAHRRKGVPGVYQKQKYLNRRPAIVARWAEMLVDEEPVSATNSFRFVRHRRADIVSTSGRPGGHLRATVPCWSAVAASRVPCWIGWASIYEHVLARQGAHAARDTRGSRRRTTVRRRAVGVALRTTSRRRRSASASFKRRRRSRSFVISLMSRVEKSNWLGSWSSRKMPSASLPKIERQPSRRPARRRRP